MQENGMKMLKDVLITIIISGNTIIQWPQYFSARNCGRAHKSIIGLLVYCWGNHLVRRQVFLIHSNLILKMCHLFQFLRKPQ